MTNKNLDQYVDAARKIYARRTMQASFNSQQNNSSEDDGLTEYISASLGSIKAFQIEFSLSLGEAADLFLIINSDLGLTKAELMNAIDPSQNAYTEEKDNKVGLKKIVIGCIVLFALYLLFVLLF